LAATSMITPAITKAVEKTLSGAIGSSITGVLKERAIDSNVIFSHSQGTGQLALFFPLGGKTGRLSRACAHIRNLVNTGRTVRIKNALSISGMGVQFGENLTDVGAIGFEGGTAFIDLSVLYSEVESHLAYVSLVQKFPKPMIKDMVITHVSQNWKPKNGKKVFFMEVLLKHPKLWRKYFPSISVRDIVFTASIEIIGLWSEVFPRKFWQHFREACIATLPDTPNSVRKRLEARLKGYFDGSPQAFITAMHQTMLEFTQKTIPQKFPHAIKVRPEGDFEIVDVIADWPVVPISGVPTPIVMFPETIRIRIITAISNNIDFCKGEVEVDMRELRHMAKPLLSDMRKSAQFWERQVRKTSKMLR